MDSDDLAAPAADPDARKRAMVGGGILVVLIVALAAVAFTRGGDEAAEPAVTTSSTTTTVAAEPITTTTEPDEGPVAPLTGLRLADEAKASRPAIAVKIDNVDTPIANALPQAGLARADVVFEEIVEGNITRLVAVFHSQDAGRVGPVRSARTTDVHLLPQLGTTLLAWSGGNGGVVAAVRGTPSIVDLGHDRATSSYSRDRSRKAPHNLFVQADELWAKAPADVVPPSPLFEYQRDGSQPATATPARGVDITWGGGGASSPAGWRWSARLKLYVREQNRRPHVDADGARVVSQNVVVLLTPYGQSPADTRSPEALTVGSGDAMVFTAGAYIPGRWERTADDQPARITDGDGNVIRLTPGQTWIELPRAGEATVVR